MNIEEFNDMFNIDSEWINNLIYYYNKNNPFDIIRNNDCSDVITDLYMVYYNSGNYIDMEFGDYDHFRASLTETLRNIFTRSGGSYVYRLVGNSKNRRTISFDDMLENKREEIYISMIEDDIDDIDLEKDAFDKWLGYSSYNRRLYGIYSENRTIRELSEKLNISDSSAYSLINRMKDEIYLIRDGRYSYEEITKIMDNKYIKKNRRVRKRKNKK